MKAFRSFAHDLGYEFKLLDEVMKINEDQRQAFLKKIRSAVWNLRGKRLGVLGVTFKGGTDDIREAVSLKIIQALLDDGSILRLYDPQAMPNSQQVFPASMEHLTYCSSAYEAARGAQALLLLTEWEDFRQLDLSRVRDLMEVPILVDGRNLFDPDVVRKAGFEYVSMGRDGARPAGLRANSGTAAS